MFSLSDYYAKIPDIRVRPVPEMGICFVYTPAIPRLYTLNTSAWLILALCDGRHGDGLVDAYAESMVHHLTRGQALNEVCATVVDLETKGIVTRVRSVG